MEILTLVIGSVCEPSSQKLWRFSIASVCTFYVSLVWTLLLTKYGFSKFSGQALEVYGQLFFIVCVLEIPCLEAIVTSPSPGCRHEPWCEGVKPGFTAHMASESNKARRRMFCHRLRALLGAFAKLRKATVSSYVFPLRTARLPRDVFSWNLILSIFRKSAEKIPVWWKC